MKITKKICVNCVNMCKPFGKFKIKYREILVYVRAKPIKKDLYVYYIQYIVTSCNPYYLHFYNILFF